MSNYEKVREDAERIILDNTSCRFEAGMAWQEINYRAIADQILSHPLIHIEADDQEEELLKRDEITALYHDIEFQEGAEDALYVTDRGKRIAQAQASKMIQGDKETKWMMVINRLARWLWPRVKCRGCRFLGQNYITSYQGQGLFRLWCCQRLPHDMEVVDPDAGRRCEFREEDKGGGNG